MQDVNDIYFNRVIINQWKRQTGERQEKEQRHEKLYFLPTANFKNGFFAARFCCLLNFKNKKTCAS